MKVSLTIEHEGKKYGLGFELGEEDLAPANFPQPTILEGKHSIDDFLYHARIHRHKLDLATAPLPMEKINDPT